MGCLADYDTEELKSIEEQTIDNFMLGVLDFLKRHKCKGIHRNILDNYVSIEYRKLKEGDKR